jgi:ArsR family transcriptional regulator
VHPHVRSLLTEIEGAQEAETAFPKPLTDDVVQAADVVVTMGCGDACPVYPGKRYQDWDLTDPAGLSLEEVRGIRDVVQARVEALLSDLLPA